MSAPIPSRRRALARVAYCLASAAAGLSIGRAVRAQAQREVEIVAQRFKFVPDTIALKAGEPVLLKIRSLDYIHGFNIPDLGIRSDLLPGMVTQVHINPQSPGTLDFLCDNFCGDDHENMHGQFKVIG